MTTTSLELTPVPADLYVDAALDAGTAYLIQNVSAGRRIFIAEAAVAPTPGETVAHVLVPGEYLIARSRRLPAQPGSGAKVRPARPSRSPKPSEATRCLSSATSRSGKRASAG